MTRVVLGSASAGRLRVLRRAGPNPLVLVSEVDDDALIASSDADTPPEAVVANRLTRRPSPSQHKSLPTLQQTALYWAAIRCCSTTMPYAASQDQRKQPDDNGFRWPEPPDIS